VGTAVVAACKGLKKKMLKIAKAGANSPFAKLKPEEVVFLNGRLYVKDQPDRSVALADLVINNNNKPIKSTNTGSPALMKLRKYSKAVHSASFVEVEVDKDLGSIKVTRALTAVAAGAIINPKTARSQILGSMVWGISKALREEAYIDHRYGRCMNPNLAEYHIPVHADINELDVIFVEEKDKLINDLGVKGVGEIAIISMVPAVVNAVYHATGIRVKKLPIMLDALLE
jgi:xanthine dehydrogenase YagR molybdenum-binding subunit